MSRVKNAEFWESQNYNNKTFMHYYNRLVELSVSMFEWKNLPDTCDPTFLELSLLATGMGVFFKDKDAGYATLRCMAAGEYDIYRVPKIRTAFADNGLHVNLTDENSVIIFNNALRKPAISDIEKYSLELYELDSTCRINVKAQKTPILVSCDESQRLSMKNVYDQYDGNRPVIYGGNNLKGDCLKVLNTQAPFVAKDLQELKVQKWNEALTYLGISNVNFQKRERMITDEVTRNQGGTIASRYSRLNERRKACKKINKIFDLHVWCDFREDYQEISDELDTVNGEPNTDGEGGEVKDE